MEENHTRTPKCYLPDPDLVQYIKDELRMKQIRRSRENAGEDLLSDEKRFERNLDKRKSTWMNKIFQMTADLIFFLECVANKPELREEFWDEYNNLFGFRGRGDEPLYYSNEVYENTFSRLISSVLQKSNIDLDTSMTATYIAQLVVYEKIVNVLEELAYSDPDIVDKITEDFSASKAWVRFLTRGTAEIPFRRKIESHNPVVQDTKSS
jgi:hypothetical protein